MSDPTCVNGGVYYNSASNQAKICINSSWAAVGVPRVTSLPGSPADGDEVYYVADSSAGVIWHLRYNSSSGYWEKIGGPPLHAFTNSSNSTASNSYTTLSNAPSITAPLAGDYDITIEADITVSNSSGGVIYDAWLSYIVGATSANDNWSATVGIQGDDDTENGNSVTSRTYRHTGITASSSIAERAKAGDGDNGTFFRRHLWVDPVRVQ